MEKEMTVEEFNRRLDAHNERLSGEIQEREERVRLLTQLVQEKEALLERWEAVRAEILVKNAQLNEQIAPLIASKALQN